MRKSLADWEEKGNYYPSGKKERRALIVLEANFLFFDTVLRLIQLSMIKYVLIVSLCE